MKIEREMDYYRSLYCSNFGDKVEMRYTNCIDMNFDNIVRDLNYSLTLRSCYNGNSKYLTLTYKSCVTENFRRIERHINSQN